MSIGSGIVLFVIGAILVFAVNIDTGGVVDLDIIGYILMGAGVVVFLIGMILMFRRRSAVTTSTTQADPASGARVTRNVSETDGPIA
jgi:membrane-bound ClpP family serine protease